MLTSSDAKWKCLWYMFVWSLLIMTVTWKLKTNNYVFFYLSAAASILVLPLVTAIYSHTSGKHGAEVLRYAISRSFLLKINPDIFHSGLD